jgi:hypothetical protein
MVMALLEVLLLLALVVVVESAATASDREGYLRIQAMSAEGTAGEKSAVVLAAQIPASVL